MIDHDLQPAPAISNELRVFVACAEADMLGEREHLARTVFPELRQLCSRRGVAFTHIDLMRDGAGRKAPQERIVRLSLDEIHRRRPFVLGLVSPSCGWEPALELAALESGLTARYPWLRQSIEQRKSLVEIEVERAMRDRFDGPEWAAFYFRTPGEPAFPAEDRRRIEELRERVRRDGFRFRENLPDVQAFGAWVRSELLHVVDRAFPEAPPFNPAELEQRAQEAFAASRRGGYIPRPALLDRLNRHVGSDDPALVIRGESGSGKSALIAWWSRELRRLHPDLPVAVYYVGIGSRTGRADFLQSMIAKIRAAIGSSGAIPHRLDELEESLPFWLAEGAAARLILVVDGADQLEEGSRDLEWLPSHLPPGLHLIVTTSRERTGVDRAWPELVVEPLSASERIALRSLLTAGEGPDSTEPVSSNPLLLRTRIEELRLAGESTRGAGAAGELLSAGSVQELFQRKLEHLESEFGEGTVGDLLGAVWGARRGLDEWELEGIVACSRLDLSELLASLEFYLLRIDGRLRFFHAELAGAVERRYASDDEAKRRTHLRLADHFERGAHDARRADELPWQLERAGAIDRLRGHLADPEMLRLFDHDELEYDLAGYWTACGGPEAMEASYIDLLDTVADIGDRHRELATTVAKFLGICGRYDASVKLLRRVLPADEESVADEGTAGALFELAESYTRLGKLADAESILRRVLAGRERTLGPEHRETVRTLERLAGVAYGRGDHGTAESGFRTALRLTESAHGLESIDAARCLNDLAAVLHARGELQEAEGLHRRAWGIWRRLRGAEHPETAIAANNLAAVLYDRGQREEAERLYGGALEIWERSLGPSHPVVADALTNLASTVAARSSSEALPYLERAVAIHRAVYDGTPHPTTALLFFTLGRAHYFLENLVDAASWYGRAHEMQRALFGADNVDAAVSLAGLARALRDAGSLDRAEEAFNGALDVLRARLGPDHQRVGHTLGDLAELHRRKGEDDRARDAALRALAILERGDTLGHPKVEQLRRLLETIGGDRLQEQDRVK